MPSVRGYGVEPVDNRIRRRHNHADYLCFKKQGFFGQAHTVFDSVIDNGPIMPVWKSGSSLVGFRRHSPWPNIDNSWLRA